ncbi:GIY-YIG nuclease family protein [Rathayibacter sp. VKM Ac-2803]|uniref:GIY-YIG nuclease family protein n=1 Tax=unclassified Rathayibacter TaxID=2609250 RepID=UPI001356B01D|nr:MULTISPECIES: GIY-YIG nuclease family protein [unclassified Rathayibacter]MWV47809.1 GIY-YIG nuclease family protein [Rathayibacter sp. VKM Ac-2803]MWV58980.1 GIY-YIG nuclease family protein [Rathayibacter sp. VKM Ac-2754]
MAFVYILRCSDGSYYVGSTRSLHRRVDAHMMGKGAEYTSRRLPVTLLWHQEFESIAEAFWWEKRIQNWSRAKREALMRGDYTALRRASKKTFPKPEDTPSPPAR